MRYRTVAVSLAGNLIVSSTRVEKVADKDAVWKPCAAVCRPTGSLRQIEPERSEDGHRDTDSLPLIRFWVHGLDRIAGKRSRLRAGTRVCTGHPLASRLSPMAGSIASRNPSAYLARL
jgi:hypothetical protein